MTPPPLQAFARGPIRRGTDACGNDYNIGFVFRVIFVMDAQFPFRCRIDVSGVGAEANCDVELLHLLQ